MGISRRDGPPHGAGIARTRTRSLLSSRISLVALLGVHFGKGSIIENNFPRGKLIGAPQFCETIRKIIQTSQSK